MGTLTLKIALLVIMLSLWWCCEAEKDDKWVCPRRPRRPVTSAPGDPRPQPGFDYFILSLQWPNSFCRNQTEPCNPVVPVQHFTLHGLWPIINDGRQLQFCKTHATPTDSMFEELGKDLLTYWPQLLYAKDWEKSKKFWHFDWTRHGSCSSNIYSPLQFFALAIRLAKQYNPLQMLLERDIRHNGTVYGSRDILKGIKAGTKYTPNISCNMDRGGNVQFYQVQICLQTDGRTLRHCRYGRYSCMGKDPIFPDVP